MKKLSIFIAIVHFLTGTLWAYAPESNFWEERQKAVQKQKKVQSSDTLLAHLPNSFGATSASVLQNLPAVQTNPLAHLNPALTQKVKKGLPQNISDRLTGLLESLPHSYGTVRKMTLPTQPYDKTSLSPIVIHIQDVHRHTEAQKNIGKTVQTLLKQNQVDLVALEGTAEPIPLQPFHTYGEPEVVQRIADYLLRENKISGPVHTGLTVPHNTPFLGIDHLEHYRANVDAYKRSAPLMDDLKNRVTQQQSALAQQKAMILNPALRSFDGHIQAYREQKIQLGDYVQVLSKTQAKVTPQVKIFLQAMAMERALNFTQVEKERTRLIERLMEGLDKEQITSLLNHSVAYRLGQIPHNAFYRHLRQLCQRNRIDLGQFPAMEDYIQYVLLADGIQAEQLFNDIKHLEQTGYAALAKTEKEKKLISQSKQLYLTSKLIDFSLTPEEWQEYETVNSDQMTVSSETMDLSSFEDFYKEAEARDKAMVQNLLRQLTVSPLQQEPPVAVLVTGGFHAPGMEKLLQKAGVTTIAFVPKITEVKTEKGSQYLSVFTQEKTPLEKLFEGEKLFVSQDPGSQRPLSEGAYMNAALDLTPNAQKLLDQFTPTWATDVKPEREELAPGRHRLTLEFFKDQTPVKTLQVIIEEKGKGFKAVEIKEEGKTHRLLISLLALLKPYIAFLQNKWFKADKISEGEAPPISTTFPGIQNLTSTGQHPVGEHDFSLKELKQLSENADLLYQRALDADDVPEMGALRKQWQEEIEKRMKETGDDVPAQMIRSLELEGAIEKISQILGDLNDDSFEIRYVPKSQGSFLTDKGREAGAFAYRNDDGKLIIYVQDLAGVIHELMEHQLGHNHTIAFFAEALANKNSESTEVQIIDIDDMGFVINIFIPDRAREWIEQWGPDNPQREEFTDPYSNEEVLRDLRKKKLDGHYRRYGQGMIEALNKLATSTEVIRKRRHSQIADEILNKTNKILNTIPRENKLLSSPGSLSDEEKDDLSKLETRFNRFNFFYDNGLSVMLSREFFIDGHQMVFDFQKRYQKRGSPQIQHILKELDLLIKEILDLLGVDVYEPEVNRERDLNRTVLWKDTPKEGLVKSVIRCFYGIQGTNHPFDHSEHYMALVTLADDTQDPSTKKRAGKKVLLEDHGEIDPTSIKMARIAVKNQLAKYNLTDNALQRKKIPVKGRQGSHFVVFHWADLTDEFKAHHVIKGNVLKIYLDKAFIQKLSDKNKGLVMARLIQNKLKEVAEEDLNLAKSEKEEPQKNIKDLYVPKAEDFNNPDKDVFKHSDESAKTGAELADILHQHLEDTKNRRQNIEDLKITREQLSNQRDYELFQAASEKWGMDMHFSLFVIAVFRYKFRNIDFSEFTAEGLMRFLTKDFQKTIFKATWEEIREKEDELQKNIILLLSNSEFSKTSLLDAFRKIFDKDYKMDKDFLMGEIDVVLATLHDVLEIKKNEYNEEIYSLEKIPVEFLKKVSAAEYKEVKKAYDKIVSDNYKDLNKRHGWDKGGGTMLWLWRLLFPTWTYEKYRANAWWVEGVLSLGVGIVFAALGWGDFSPSVLLTFVGGHLFDVIFWLGFKAFGKRAPPEVKGRNIFINNAWAVLIVEISLIPLAILSADPLLTPPASIAVFLLSHWGVNWLNKLIITSRHTLMPNGGLSSTGNEDVIPPAFQDFVNEYGVSGALETLRFLTRDETLTVADFARVKSCVNTSLKLYSHSPAPGDHGISDVTRQVMGWSLKLDNEDPVQIFTKGYDKKNNYDKKFEKEVALQNAVWKKEEQAPEAHLVKSGKRGYFIVLRAAQGIPLSKIPMDDWPLAMGEAILTALGNLHSILVHGDLIGKWGDFKKEHIFIDFVRGGYKVQFIDFGLSRSIAESSSQDLDKEAEVIVTELVDWRKDTDEVYNTHELYKSWLWFGYYNQRWADDLRGKDPTSSQKNMGRIVNAYRSFEIPEAQWFEGLDAKTLSQIRKLTGRSHLWNKESLADFYERLAPAIARVRQRTGQDPVIVEAGFNWGDLAHGLKALTDLQVFSTTGKLGPIDRQAYQHRVSDRKFVFLPEHVILKEGGAEKVLRVSPDRIILLESHSYFYESVVGDFLSRPDLNLKEIVSIHTETVAGKQTTGFTSTLPHLRHWNMETAFLSFPWQTSQVSDGRSDDMVFISYSLKEGAKPGLESARTVHRLDDIFSDQDPSRTFLDWFYAHYWKLWKQLPTEDFQQIVKKLSLSPETFSEVNHLLGRSIEMAPEKHQAKTATLVHQTRERWGLSQGAQGDVLNKLTKGGGTMLWLWRLLFPTWTYEKYRANAWWIEGVFSLGVGVVFATLGWSDLVPTTLEVFVGGHLLDFIVWPVVKAFGGRAPPEVKGRNIFINNAWAVLIVEISLIPLAILSADPLLTPPASIAVFLLSHWGVNWLNKLIESPSHSLPPDFVQLPGDISYQILDQLVEELKKGGESVNSGKRVNLRRALSIAQSINPTLNSPLSDEKLRSAESDDFLMLVKKITTEVFLPAHRFFDLRLQPDHSPSIHYANIREGTWERIPYLEKYSIWSADVEWGKFSKSPSSISYDNYAFVDPEISQLDAHSMYYTLRNDSDHLSHPGKISTEIMEKIKMGPVTYGEYFGELRNREKKIFDVKNTLFTALLHGIPSSEVERDVIVDSILKPASTLIVDNPPWKKVSPYEEGRDTFLLSIIKFSGQLGGLISEMELHIKEGRHDVAHLAFWNFFATLDMVDSSQISTDSLVQNYMLIELFDNNKILSYEDLFYVINLVPEHPSVRALELLKEIYQTNFWTDEERLEKIKTKMLETAVEEGHLAAKIVRDEVLSVEDELVKKLLIPQPRVLQLNTLDGIKGLENDEALNLIAGIADRVLPKENEAFRKAFLESVKEKFEKSETINLTEGQVLDDLLIFGGQKYRAPVEELVKAQIKQIRRDPTKIPVVKVAVQKNDLTAVQKMLDAVKTENKAAILEGKTPARVLLVPENNEVKSELSRMIVSQNHVTVWEKPIVLLRDGIVDLKSSQRILRKWAKNDKIDVKNIGLVWVLPKGFHPSLKDLKALPEDSPFKDAVLLILDALSAMPIHRTDFQKILELAALIAQQA